MGEFFGDGEAEAGARVLASVGAVELVELFEDACLFVGGDPRTGVEDAEADSLGVASVGSAEDFFGAERDDGGLARFFGGFGELHGVREEVEDDLLKFFQVGGDDGDVVVDLDFEGDALAVGERVDEAYEALAGVAEDDLGGVNLDFSGLDFGHFEQAVDHVEECSAGGLDVVEIAEALGEYGRDFGACAGGVGACDVEEEVREADDGVEGCAELVAYAGEELSLEFGGVVEGDVAFGEFVNLEVESGVDGAELVLAGLQVDEHDVEGFGEFLELVAGGDFGADSEVSLADAFGSVFECADGAEDELVGDEVEDEDGEA